MCETPKVRGVLATPSSILMKQILIFQADDGTRFDNDQLCQRYEAQCEIINQAMALLKPIPKNAGCNFANGGGFIQQDKAAVLMAYGMVLDVAENIAGKDVVAKTKAAHEFAPRSIIGRYLDDSGHRAIYKAWHRFLNMDAQWREWGQGYFAANPHEGKQLELAA